MSSSAWALALLAAAAVPTLSAQDSAVGRLRARADSLAREWRRASAIADLVDSLERDRAGAGRDTIAVGALRIVTNPSPLPVREAAARAWPVIDSLYGEIAQRLVTRPYVIQATDPDTAVTRSTIHVGVAVPWDTDVESLMQLVLSSVPLPPLDAALNDWLGGVVRPSLRPVRDRADVYVRLVTAPSEPARRCLLGDLAGCRDALALTDSADPVERWYPSAAERRALLLRAFGTYFDRGASARELRACAQGNDASCTGLLRSLPKGALPRPLGAAAHATLVHTALRLGGREAYARLVVPSAAPLADRIAGAAGVPLDSLLARWRREVIAARPAPVALPALAVVLAIGWTVLFAACGARSSRWRVT